MLTFVLAALTVLNNGACLDSARSVPQGLFGTEPGAAIVKIDKVVSTAAMTDGEIIGYLYTRQDDRTYLGQRQQEYMSAADRLADQPSASVHAHAGRHHHDVSPRSEIWGKNVLHRDFPGAGAARRDGPAAHTLG